MLNSSFWRATVMNKSDAESELVGRQYQEMITVTRAEQLE
jgi:hypothetical protein